MRKCVCWLQLNNCTNAQTQLHKTQQQAKALRFNLQPFNFRNPEIPKSRNSVDIYAFRWLFLYYYDPKSWQKPPKHFSLDAVFSVFVVTFYYLQYQLYII